MKQKTILITAAALALSAWSLCAQEQAPPPRQNPPPHENGPRRPEADRPDARRDQEARSQWRDGRVLRDERPNRQVAPPLQQAGPGGDFRRQGPPPQMQRGYGESPQAGPRGDQQGPRFGQRGRGPGGGMRAPQMRRPENRFAGGPGDSQFGRRPFGMRRQQRPMMDNSGFAPRRGNDQDFRRDGNEMRAPMPPPQQQRGPQDDRFGPGRGPGPGLEQMDRRAPQDGPREMMRPRPNFERSDRQDRGPRGGFDGPRSQMNQSPRDDRGPRPEFNGPRPPMGPPPQDDRGPRSERPRRGGPASQGWGEGQRQPI